MAIDPSHLPIFGDPRPTAAPPPVRVAAGLFVAEAALSAAHLSMVWARTDLDLSLYVVPLAVSVWLAVMMTSGRDWARAGASAMATLAVLLSLAMLTGWLDALLVLPMVAAAVGGTCLVYRSDLREFFTPSDAEQR